MFDAAQKKVRQVRKVIFKTKPKYSMEVEIINAAEQR